jgi:hypothetical protein
MSDSTDTSAPVVKDPPRLNRPDNWRNRRFALLGSSAFYAVVILYCLLLGSPTSAIHQNGLNMGFIALMSNMGLYIFGPIWEDVSMLKHGFLPPDKDLRR